MNCANYCKYLYIVCDGLSLQNGEVSYNLASMNGQYNQGTAASFTCDSGFKLIGPNSRICGASGTWTQRTPVCEQSKKFLIF